VVEERFDGLIESGAAGGRRPYRQVVKAAPHSAVYLMHKFWARRPHNVFAELVAHYSEPGDVVLDPFCGGGVTVVEALSLGRKVVGVDVNPLAAYVTEMEVRPLDVGRFWRGYEWVRSQVESQMCELYQTFCPKCHANNAVFDWLEWTGEKPHRMKYECPKCGAGEKEAQAVDVLRSQKVSESFEVVVSEKKLWYPKAAVPYGDKTEGIVKKGYTYFWQLYTERNLLALSMLLKEICNFGGEANVKDFLKFAFSSSLKWASKMSHLRGNVVEGWALHAYWLYPRTLEINVWNTFKRRCAAVARGKEYSNRNVGVSVQKAECFKQLLAGDANYLILTQSSVSLPIPDETVDFVLTDPPFGGNVNYGELADYWTVWQNEGSTIDKNDEIIINKNRMKGLNDYEEGLQQVFCECFRVLKEERNMVVTFNSRDSRVVASFIIAAAKAGFVLHPQGLLYQPPIRAYATTFHAMQVGAFTGDFIFTFYKPSRVNRSGFLEKVNLKDFRMQIDSLIEWHAAEKTTEPELREDAYRILIPFLSFHAESNIHACWEAVNHFELRMKDLEPRFRKLRRHITEKRKKVFSADKKTG
jgi:16S rRNA G966 N2-methylase RsmD/predicted nucleic-acid-binding Zn-ribbon protein